jgi:cell division transport system permease protein
MSGALSLHSRAVGQAARRLARKPFNTVLSALVIAIALTLPALGYVMLDSLGGLVRGMSGRPEISVFLRKDVTTAQANAVENRLRGDSRISALRFVPRDVALKQLAARGGFADVDEALANNPLPDAFVLEPVGSDPDEFELLRKTISIMPEVGFVQLDSQWVERLHGIIGFVRGMLLFVAVLLGLALVIVTFNTIRLQILTLRHEISVSLLLGATRAFVRRPFLYYGLLQGLAGGLLAWLALLVLMQWIGPQIQQFAQSYNIVIDPKGPVLVQGLALAGFAGFLGWAGAGLSVHRHLHDGVAD